jgi:hypothetical protein
MKLQKNDKLITLTCLFEACEPAKKLDKLADAGRSRAGCFLVPAVNTTIPGAIEEIM